MGRVVHGNKIVKERTVGIGKVLCVGLALVLVMCRCCIGSGTAVFREVFETSVDFMIDKNIRIVRMVVGVVMIGKL